MMVPQSFEDGEKKPISTGPWGGQNGHHWDDGEYTDMRQAVIAHGPLQSPNITRTLVQSHQFVTNGHDKHGGFSVIQGSVGQSYDIVLAVRQKNDSSKPLAFQNKPVRQDSHSKEFNEVGTKDKVGAPKVQLPKVVELPKELPPKEQAPKDLPKLLQPKVAGTLTFGPWGGNGGATFDDGVYRGIRQIKLSRNVGIVWMKVMYDEDGEAKWGSKHGGMGGFRSDKIVFDYPSEILTHITGTMGSLMYMGPTIINSLTFYTNKAKYGPFGEEQGPSFTSKMKDGRIVGFHGREALFLDAIGVHVMEGKVPPPTLPPPTTTTSIATVPKETKPVAPPQWPNQLVGVKGFPTEDVSCGFVKEPAPCGPGPWGGDGGSAWDDGVLSGIKQIFLTRGEAICSLQIEYDRNGQSLWSVKHGGSGGISTHRIKLEYPREVLVCISGYYSPITKGERPTVIRSLTFHTSKGKYGPYGEEVGTYFTSTTTQGKVVGFHGRSGMYLDAVGVHMQHWLGQQKPPKQSLFWKSR